MTNLVWRCDTCTEPIANAKGYVHVNLASVHRYENAKADWERAHPGPFIDLTDFDTHPDAVPWLAHHRACDPFPNNTDYWFDVARARTHAQLLDWTAHLMEKNWLPATNWNDLIRSKAAVDA